MIRKRVAVIGYPLAHSISPRFQQPAFDALGLPVDYLARETPPEGLASFIAAFRADDAWLGLNVTVPHKEAMFRLVDEVTEEAQLIGAVNTVTKRQAPGVQAFRRSGTQERHGASTPGVPASLRPCVPVSRLVGHNTDAVGFLRALREDAGFEPSGRAALVLGAGGASRAVVVALARAGAARVLIANRHRDRAERLAGHLNQAFARPVSHVVAWDDRGLRAAAREVDLLVNTTSVGMAHGPAPDQSPLPADALDPHLLVYDLVYNPSRTRLLQDAERSGARTQEGLPMLVYQGAASFELWTGQAAPVAVMLEHGKRALREREDHGRPLASLPHRPVR